MKTLIIPKIDPANTIPLNEVNPRYHYIGCLNEQGSKGFIIRDDYCAGRYMVKALWSLTAGNGWEQYNNRDLQTVLRELVYNNWEVFIFESRREFLLWLAEE
jgi:hypothetical protein